MADPPSKRHRTGSNPYDYQSERPSAITMADPPSKRPRTGSNPYDYQSEPPSAKPIKNPAREGPKIFNDPVHGHIQMNPLCVKIIDTPQFQRLRLLKQLGNIHLVYPGASHTRFAHSIGVCYLAGQFIRAIKQEQPELNINESDILCVEIAGLCHDLGHGPFSHLFDEKFLRKVRQDEEGRKWTHEKASVEMLEFLLEENKLRDEFKKSGLTEIDIMFIKEQIYSEGKKTVRPKEKHFLYEIVSNKINGIDVDKWDYFARDCLMLGIKNSFDHVRLMKFARVLKVMENARYVSETRACQHITVRCIDEMLGKALIEANNYIKFQGKDGKKVKMSEAIGDMEAYMKMNDYSVVFKILHSSKRELKTSKQLLEKIEKRQLYKFIGQTQLKGKKIMISGPTQSILEEKREKLQEKIKTAVLGHLKPSIANLEKIKDEVFVEIVVLNYGERDQNPIDKVRFYTKLEPLKTIQLTRDQVSQLLPARVQEELIRIYSKTNDEYTIKILKQAMCEWCKQKNYPPPIRM